MEVLTGVFVSLLRFDAVSTGKQLSTFWMIVQPQLRGQGVQGLLHLEAVDVIDLNKQQSRSHSNNTPLNIFLKLYLVRTLPSQV